jgi:hypothetical protein
VKKDSCKMNGRANRALLAALALGCLTARDGLAQSAAQSPPAQSPVTSAVLDRIEPGLWELRSVDDRPPSPTRLCAADRRHLLQPLHRGPLCRQLVTASGPDQVTVAYACAARGQGRTALRIETPRLVQIDSQGIAGGRPFAARFEGRRIGDCPAHAHPPGH